MRHFEDLSQAGQAKPTPLRLHYEAEVSTCLHQDLYGDVSFPLQMVFLLGQQGRDWKAENWCSSSNTRGAIQGPGGCRRLRTSDHFHDAAIGRSKARAATNRVNLRHGSVACIAARATRWGSFSTTRNDDGVVKRVSEEASTGFSVDQLAGNNLVIRAAPQFADDGRLRGFGVCRRAMSVLSR